MPRGRDWAFLWTCLAFFVMGMAALWNRDIVAALMLCLALWLLILRRVWVMPVYAWEYSDNN